MDRNEFERLTERLRANGLNDDDIANVLIQTFLDGECDIKDLEVMMGWLGYSLTEEFYKNNNIIK